MTESSNPYDPPQSQSNPSTSPSLNSWRHRTFAAVGFLLALILLLRFAGSRWGVWPWHFSPREAAFDQFELFIFFLVPLAFTATIALFAGRARRWILGLLALTFVLSLI